MLGAIVLVGLLAWAGAEVWSRLQPPGPPSASGSLEADEVLLGPEVAGRLVALPVHEGQVVRGGDVVARLDDRLVQVQLEQADAAQQQQLKVQADKYVVRVPLPGVATVTRVPVHLGEVVSAGQTVAAVADLARLKATVYVLEQDLGRIQVGQPVDVVADPLPDRVFAGTVTSINSQAEFTPRNVQTRRDRLNLVFGVQIDVPNPEGLLKPGMPVDVSFPSSGPS